MRKGEKINQRKMTTQQAASIKATHYPGPVIVNVEETLAATRALKEILKSLRS